MEDDVDIYMDLPNFTLKIDEKAEQNQACNCEALKEELNSLKTKLESIEKTNKTLEKNLFSLLKTAKAEIVRKDKMINDLRTRLDNVAFRRNNSGSVHSSAHTLPHQEPTVTEKYGSIVPLMDSKEIEFKSHEFELHHDEHTSPKQPNDLDRIPVTVFGERLHKRLMENEKEEKRQKALLKLNVKTNAKKVSEECVVESDKENGSQSHINNNDNESGISIQNDSSETSCTKNPRKRTNDESDICKNKRLRIDDNEDKEGKTTEEADYNCIVQHDVKNNLARDDMKDDFTQFEDRLNVTQSFEKESSNAMYRNSEHEDMKQDRSYTNQWRKNKTSYSTKEHNTSRSRQGSVDTSRSSRSASRSNISEEYNNDYHHNYYINSNKKDDYRNSSSNYKNYSRSKNNYECSKKHYLRETSSRMYRDVKYDNYKYDNRYRDYKLKGNYDIKENDKKSRYNNRERDYRRDKLSHSLSDIEDRESRSDSYNNRTYKSCRVNNATTNVSNKRLYERDKTAVETDVRTYRSQSVVNTVASYSVKKNTEQHNIKNETDIKFVNSAENTSINIATVDSNYLEDGEILDSPTSSPAKKDNFVKISKYKQMENIKTIPVNKSEEDINVPANLSRDILIRNNEISMKLNKVMDINVQETQISSLSQTNLKIVDHESEVVTTIEEAYNDKNDNNDIDNNQLSIKTSHKISKDNIETDYSRLTDRNCIQDIPIDPSTNSVQELFMSSKDCEVIPETQILKNTKSEKTIKTQTLDTRKMIPNVAKNKKDEQGKGIVISRRRRAVTLGDNKASMTMFMNTEEASITSNCSDNDPILKPRACKLMRTYKNNM